MSDTSTMTLDEIEAETARLRALSELRHQQYWAKWNADRDEERRADDARRKREEKWRPWQMVAFTVLYLLFVFAGAAFWIEDFKAVGLWK